MVCPWRPCRPCLFSCSGVGHGGPRKRCCSPAPFRLRASQPALSSWLPGATHTGSLPKSPIPDHCRSLTPAAAPCQPLNPRLRINIGNVYFEQARYPQAIKSYRMALDTLPAAAGPQRARLLRNIGLAFVRMGQYADATAAYEAALGAQEEHQAGLLAWGHVGSQRAGCPVCSLVHLHTRARVCMRVCACVVRCVRAHMCVYVCECVCMRACMRPKPYTNI